MLTHEVRSVEDVLRIMTLFEQMQKEVRPNIAFSAERVQAIGAMILNDFERKNINLWYTIRPDDEVTGFLVASRRGLLFADEWIAQDEVWFVRKESRGSSSALKLLLAFEQWARVGGAIQAYAGTARFEKDENYKNDAIFNKLGYTNIGTTWMKDLRNDPRLDDPRYTREERLKRKLGNPDAKQPDKQAEEA